MKFLVLGCTGMAGHVISMYLKEQGEQVLGYSRRPASFCESVQFDIFDKERLKECILKEAFDVVVNCIGILNTDADRNKSEAVYLNSYLPHYLATLTKDTPTKIVHLSTDCVFSGRKGRYLDTDFPDGNTFYDRSKSLGELVDDKNLTFRNSIIGPDISQDGKGLLNWFMLQQDHIFGYKGTIWGGVSTIVLARAILRSSYEQLTGLYQLTNNIEISKYDLCCLFNKYFKNASLVVEPTTGPKLNKSLVRSTKEFDFVVPSYEEMVEDMKHWVDKHSFMYPHYF